MPPASSEEAPLLIQLGLFLSGLLVVATVCLVVLKLFRVLPW